MGGYDTYNYHLNILEKERFLRISRNENRLNDMHLERQNI